MNPLILALVKELISLGANEIKVYQTLKQHGIDPAEYQAAVDDARTFNDFHGPNPQGAQPEPAQPSTDPTATRYQTVEDAIAIAQNLPGYGVFELEDGTFEIFPTSIGPAPGRRAWPV